MHRDIFLRADTEADLKAALPWAVEQEGEPEGRTAGDWITQAPGYAIVLIGRVQTGEAEFDDRFHANLRLVDGFDPDVPEGVIIHPENQRRVFA